MPVRSLTIIAYAVWCPWPCDSVPHRTMAEPSVAHLDGAELGAVAAGGDLDVRGHADAELDAVAAGAAHRLLLAQVVVPDGVGCHVERQRVVAAVVLSPLTVVNGNAVGGERLRRRSSIGSTPSSRRRLVHEALEQRGGLRPPGAAVRAHRRGVGDRHRHVELDAGDVVRAVRHLLGEPAGR